MKLQPRLKGVKELRSTALDLGRTELHPDKGKENGRCNRTACQRPLADESEHQFMDGLFTGGPRLFYCGYCALEFDMWDYRSGDPVRIKREPKVCEAT